MLTQHKSWKRMVLQALGGMLIMVMVGCAGGDDLDEPMDDDLGQPIQNQNYANNEDQDQLLNNEDQDLDLALDDEGDQNLDDLQLQDGENGQDLGQLDQDSEESVQENLAMQPAEENLAPVMDEQMEPGFVTADGADGMGDFAAPQSTTGGIVGGGAGESAGQGLPELGSKMAYVVVKGDTLSLISKRIYGDYSKYTELAENSGISNPNRIYPGDVVYYQLTQEAVGFATEYESRDMLMVQIQKGDTLVKIASRLYGSSQHWKVLWRLNHEVDYPDQLAAGSWLKIDHINLRVDPAALAAAVTGAAQKTEQKKDFA